MKSLFNSRIAAIAAACAAAVVGWFVDKGILTGDTAAQATTELGTLFNVLGATLFGIVVLVGGWVLKRLAGGNSGGGNNKTGGSGGSFPSIAITATALFLAGLALSSCSGLSLTGDGCITSTFTRDGATYQVKSCLGEDGKLSVVKVLWKNEAGAQLRATVHLDNSKPVVIEYQTVEGGWVTWTEGSGVSLGQVPAEVKTALGTPAVEASSGK